MHFIEEVTEHEMVAVFLQAEIVSARFGEEVLRCLVRYGIDRGAIACPDTSNELENSYRLKVLGEYRGYRQDRDYFEGFPHDVAWQRVALGRDELLRVRYINYSYWTALSVGSRLPVAGAATIREGRTVFGVPIDSFLRAAEALRHGATFPELICVRAGAGSRVVVLEGHLRLTAYALAPEVIPDDLTVVLGTSANMVHWGCY